MTHIRIFILVLLAVLLPVRGAVAAAMMCPDGGGADAARVVESAHHEMHADAGMHADHSASHQHAAQDDASDSPSAACHFCATGCCMASIVGTFPPMPQPDVTVSVVFPALTAPVPVFQSDGQDRPPRTI